MKRMREMKKIMLVSAMMILLLVSSGCKNKLEGDWILAGSDFARKIDHYYLKKDVKPMGPGVFRIRTKLIPQRGKSLEKVMGIKNTYSVEVDGVVFCEGPKFRVFTKEYLDKQGISLLIEKDGGTEEATVKVTRNDALFPMVNDICATAPKPVQQQSSTTAAKTPDGKNH